MIHAYAVNALKGHTHAIKQCTCGYIEYIKKEDIDEYISCKTQEYCPNCGTPLMWNDINNLSFSSTHQCQNIGRIKTKNKACYLELELYSLNFFTAIDFSKKTLKIDKRRIKNNKVTIVFDASQKPEDFIKYYNSNDEIITIEELKESLATNANYSINNIAALADKFSMIHRKFSYHMNKTAIANVLDFLEDNTEFFIKYEQLIKSNIDPYLIQSEINLTKTNPIEMLGVRPFTFKYIRSLQKTISLSGLKAIKVMEEKIGDQAVNYLQTFGQDAEGLQVRFMNTILDLVCEADLSVTKLYKYIYKDAPIKQFLINPSDTITLLKDSFEMSKQLGLVFNKNSKSLRKYHDELVEEYKAVEDELLAKSFTKSMETRKYLAYTEKDSKYCIIVPTESQELVKEGQELKHCVGSYIKRVAKGTSYIVFLREKEKPEQSFTTIEVDEEDNIVQIRKKHNADLTENDAREFLKNWAAVNGLNLKRAVSWAA